MIKGSLLLSAPIVKHFRSKKTVPFWAKIWRFWGINRDLKLNLSFITPKRHILAWFHVFWAIARKNPSTGLSCSLIKEKKGINKYFTHLQRSPQWMDFYQIWYRRSPRGRNQLCRIFCRLVQAYWFCGGLKFAFAHKNWRSPLTLSELPFRLWCSKHWPTSFVPPQHSDHR